MWREAQTRAYAAVNAIDWPGGFVAACDIGWRAISRSDDAVIRQLLLLIAGLAVSPLDAVVTAGARRIGFCDQLYRPLFQLALKITDWAKRAVAVDHRRADFLSLLTQTWIAVIRRFTLVAMD